MGVWLKQSTAATVLIGPFVDDTDGKTAETGLTIAQADVRVSKNGGDMAQKSDATSCTHDELGYYTCPLNTTDTGTLGRLRLMVTEAGALPVWHEFLVVPAAVYDSLVLGTDYLPADAVQVEGGDATDAINAACDTAISDASLATAAALATVDGIVDDILVDTGTTLPASIAALPTDSDVQVAAAAALTAYDPPTNAELLSAISPLATAAALATVDGVVDAILVDTGTTLMAELDTIGSKVDAVDNYVDTEVALIKAKTDQLTFTTPGKVDATAEVNTAGLATAADLAVVDGIVDAILVDTGTTLPDSLAAISGKVDTVDTVVDAVLVDTGTTIPASIAALPTNADVQVAAAAALTAYDPPTKAELDSAVSPLATSAALATVDTVVDSILVDTGTTLPGQLTIIEGKVNTVDTVVDSIKTLVQRVYRYFYNIREHTPNKTIVYADDGVTIDAEMSVGGDETSVIKGAAE